MFKYKKLLYISLISIGIVLTTILSIIFLIPKSTLSINLNNIMAIVNEEFTLPIITSDEFVKIDYKIENEEIVEYLGNDIFKAIKIGKTNIIVTAINFENNSVSSTCVVEVFDMIPNFDKENEKDKTTPNEDKTDLTQPKPTTPNEPQKEPQNDESSSNKEEQKDSNTPAIKNQFTLKSVNNKNEIADNKIFIKENTFAFIYILFDENDIKPEFKYNKDKIEINEIQTIKLCYKIAAKESTEIEVYNNNTYLGSILIEIIK